MSLVMNVGQICDGIEEFYSNAYSDIPMASDLLRKSTYWVYDQNTNNFGPGKFVGFAEMTFDAYRGARETQPPEFDGGLTRRAIERVSGLNFANDDNQTKLLISWAKRVIGADVLDGVKKDKWKFLTLPFSLNIPGQFTPNPNLPALFKDVGKSQHQDGVRIDVGFHDLFNPPSSEFHVPKGDKRVVSVFFNGKVFDAHYVFEGTKAAIRDMQRIQFGAGLIDEFKKVFPNHQGQFTIQASSDLNHFLFGFRTKGYQSYSENLERRVTQARRDSQSDRLERLRAAPKKAATVQVTTTAYARNPDVIAEALARAIGKCEDCQNDAPFLRTKDGTPYLEVHHRIPLAEGGEDTVENAIALCPNCHRKAHYG